MGTLNPFGYDTTTGQARSLGPNDVLLMSSTFSSGINWSTGGTYSLTAPEILGPTDQDMYIRSASAGTTSAGRDLWLQAGQGGSTSGDGGWLYLYGGLPTSGVGGGISIVGRDGGGSGKNGANVSINAGGSESAQAGSIFISAGGGFGGGDTAGDIGLSLQSGSTRGKFFLQSGDGIEIFKILDSGSIQVPQTIDTTAGDSVTINKISGRFRKDTSGTTFTVTNSLVTANSIVILTFVDADATATSMAVAAGSGSFVVTFNAAPTANCNVNFLVLN